LFIKFIYGKPIIQYVPKIYEIVLNRLGVDIIMAVNIVLVNGKVVKGGKIEGLVSGAKLFFSAMSDKGLFSSTLANLVPYKIKNAEIDNKNINKYSFHSQVYYIFTKNKH